MQDYSKSSAWAMELLFLALGLRYANLNISWLQINKTERKPCARFDGFTVWIFLTYTMFYSEEGCDLKMEFSYKSLRIVCLIQPPIFLCQYAIHSEKA